MSGDSGISTFREAHAISVGGSSNAAVAFAMSMLLNEGSLPVARTNEVETQSVGQTMRNTGIVLS